MELVINYNQGVWTWETGFIGVEQCKNQCLSIKTDDFQDCLQQKSYWIKFKNDEGRKTFSPCTFRLCDAVLFRVKVKSARCQKGFDILGHNSNIKNGYYKNARKLCLNLIFQRWGKHQTLENQNEVQCHDDHTSPHLGFQVFLSLSETV